MEDSVKALWYHDNFHVLQHKFQAESENEED